MTNLEPKSGSINGVLDISVLIKISELQKLQDLFSDVHQIASIITNPDGKPITTTSNFCRLCTDVIKKTEKGARNCEKSNSLLGKCTSKGPNVQKCFVAGIWEAGVCIKFGDNHVANWLIGQVRNEDIDEVKIAHYANEIGVDKELFIQAYKQVPVMHESKFRKIAEMLNAYVNQLTESTYNKYLLKQANDELKQISQNLPDIIWKGEYNIRTEKITNTYISDVADELLVIPKGTIKNSFENYFSFVVPGYSKKLQATILQGIENPGKSYSIIYKVKRGDGKNAWFESSGRANKYGDYVKIYGSTKDISEKILLESELKKNWLLIKENEKRYRELAEHLPSGVAVYLPIDNGNDFQFVDFNTTAEKITNIEKDKIIGKKLLDEFPNMKESPLFNALQKVNRTDKEVYIPPFYYKDKKREGWHENSIYKLPNGEIVAIFKDVTDLKSAKKKLKTKNKKLKEAKLIAEQNDHLKSAFLANMSHEIRTPLNGILGFNDLLQTSNLNESERINYSNIITECGQRLLNTINDIIDYSKIEANDISLTIEDVDLIQEFNYYLSFFEKETTNKNLKLVLNIPKNSHDTRIRTDKNKLNSILTNLLKNAIKFTSEGEISFGYELNEDELKCYVKDTGIGIPKDKISTVFNRFEQADLSMTRGHEGSGLGLAICNGYLEKLGGNIWVESEMGKGSTFWVTLKLAKQNKTQKKVNNEAEEVGLSEDPIIFTNKKVRILVAEDDEISYCFLEVLLKKQGFEVIHAKNGVEAVNIYVDDPGFSLIFMDIKMPELNGFEATKQIRKVNKEIPIIAQTAFAQPSDAEKALKVGCNDYIAKPIVKEELFKLIAKYVE